MVKKVVPPKNPVGRPPKYKVEYVEGIVHYFLACQQVILVDRTYYNPNPSLKEEEEGIKWPIKSEQQKIVMDRFPTFQRYAQVINVDEDTMLAWEKKYPEFHGARRRCKKIQEAILLENWLQWTYNSQFVQFLLKNNFGYSDKTEVANINITKDFESLNDTQKDAVNSVLASLNNGTNWSS